MVVSSIGHDRVQHAVGRYGDAVRFGVRLPGPFRASIDSSGQFTAGMSLGPVTMSTSGSRRARPDRTVLLPSVTVDQVAADLVQRHGFRVAGSRPGWAMVTRRWHAVELTAAPEGVVATASWSARAVGVVALVAVAVALLAIEAWTSI